MRPPRRTIALSPAYDLVSSRLAIAAESDELALTVNGKRDGLSEIFTDRLDRLHDYSRRGTEEARERSKRRNRVERLLPQQ